MLEYSRIVRKHPAPDPIKWIEVLSKKQLEPLLEFGNYIKSETYYATPEILDTCSKNLTNPLAAFHSYMKIILTSVVPNTTEYLRSLNKKGTNYDEITQFIFCSLAKAAQAYLCADLQHKKS